MSTPVQGAGEQGNWELTPDLNLGQAPLLYLEGSEVPLYELITQDSSWRFMVAGF